MRWRTRFTVSACVGAVSVAALGAATPRQSTREALADGVAVERPIAAGADHPFTLPVTAGSAVLLTVDQHGADVRVTVDPAGAGRMVADEPDRGTDGRELLVWNVPADGAAAVTISATHVDAAGGRYALRADRLEPAEGLAASVDAFNAAATVTRGGSPEAAADQVRALGAALDL